MQIQVSWLLQKPTDLDFDCLQRQDISRFGRTRINSEMVLILNNKKETILDWQKAAFNSRVVLISCGLNS